MLFCKIIHGKPKDIHFFALTDAMTPRHRLIFHPGIPMRTHKIDLAKFLKIKSFAPRLDLKDQDIAVTIKISVFLL